MLFDTDKLIPGSVDKLISENIELLLICSVAFVVLLIAVTLWIIYKQRKEKPVTGKEELIGVKGVARTVVDKKGGMVFIEGELWKAESVEEVIQPKEKIEVTGLEGLELRVKKIGED